MTVYGLIASLAWTATAVLCISRMNTFAHRWLDARTQENTQAVIPDDLVGFAMLESEKHAQDSVLKVIRERYDDLKDWNKVRSAIGLAEVSA